MSEWREDDPWWPDTGKRVEAVLDDGRTVAGDLWADDYAAITEGPDAGEEIPFFILHTASGPMEWFSISTAKWRVVGEARL